MHWDGTITAGNLLSLVFLFLGGVGIYIRVIEKLGKIDEKITKIDQRYEPVYRWWDRHINNGHSGDRGFQNGD